MTVGTWAAGILLAGAVIVAVLMNVPRPKHQDVTGDAENAGGAEDTESVLAHHRSLGRRSTAAVVTRGGVDDRGPDGS
ncbi:hypothetical protein [Streptomyces sp. NPDC006527]|uniref:hypothetical protein n=1 Tax=Streptomyces sp. NPDC006527 TaxID=3364749 RepID=UPI0036853F7B